MNNDDSSVSSVSVGSTDSERYLARLSRKAFLSLWAYPNIFTDEGRRGGRGAGKELCDLLVVFGNDVLLFSDKHCQYKNTGNVAIDWARWYRRAVVKSTDQLYGAEKWLRERPQQVFLDKLCEHHFPFSIPASADTKYHRIAVTRGAAEACRQHYGGSSSASLPITNEVTGRRGDGEPFVIGRVSSEKSFVHVLDETTLDILMGELDTIADFVAYLNKKETFLISSGRQVLATGEEQILAIYLTKQNEAGEHDITLPKGAESADGISIGEGFWEDLKANPQYLAKKRADKISYMWDELVEKFINIGDPQLLKIPMTEGKKRLDVEPGLRAMASESRFRRRFLGDMFVGMLREMPPGKTYMRFLPSQDDKKQACIFVAVPRDVMPTYEQYREARFGLLLAYCKIARLKDRNANGIVGIAFDNDAPHFRNMSEDFAYLDYSAWDANQEAEAVELQKQIGVMLDPNLKLNRGRWKEWPDVAGPTQIVPTASHRLAPNRAERRKEAKRQRRAK